MCFKILKVLKKKTRTSESILHLSILRRTGRVHSPVIEPYGWNRAVWKGRLTPMRNYKSWTTQCCTVSSGGQQRETAAVSVWMVPYDFLCPMDFCCYVKTVLCKRGVRLDSWISVAISYYHIHNMWEINNCQLLPYSRRKVHYYSILKKRWYR